MSKFVFEATPDERNIFDKHETDVDGIKELMSDLAKGEDILDEDGKLVSKAQANDTLRSFALDFVGLKKGYSRRDFKRAFESGRVRRLFDIIEEIEDDQRILTEQIIRN